MASPPLKYTSGLDFSDRTPTSEVDPDVPTTSARLQRNRTERRRLQGLQRSSANSPTHHEPFKPNSWRQRFDLWMINEGGRRMFFSVWILLHLLVAVFGFLNYQLKDDFNIARADFGVTFGSLPWFPFFDKHH